MASYVDVLAEMGFERARAEKALERTDNAGIEAAMEWLLSNPAEMETSEGEVQDETKAPKEGGKEETASSLKCEDCGKLFPGVNEAEFHATKSGHSNFSESTESVKPLTEEEKQTQLLRVQEMLKKRRKEREEKEKQEQLEREKSRRLMGKEISQAKQKFEEQERKKLADQRKREKEEEKLARQRVKDEIEKDRQDREAKYTSAPPAETAAAAQPQQPAPAVQQQTASKEYTETRIQVRLVDGSKMVESFRVKETLASVRLFVQEKSSEYSGVPFTFATTFPKKDYTESDMQTPLDVLGLVPSAVLMVKKLPAA